MVPNFRTCLKTCKVLIGRISKQLERVWYFNFNLPIRTKRVWYFNFNLPIIIELLFLIARGAVKNEFF
jgi:hypothetical protein